MQLSKASRPTVSGCRSRGLSACAPAPLQLAVRAREVAPCGALKRIIEPAYFQDIYDGAADRVIATGGSLKREETLVLVESCRSVEHAYKTLELIVRHLENRAGMDVNDWHHRKKYYMRLCELAMKMERGPDVVFAIFGNLNRFQVATYFGKEVIARLGSKGAHPGILLRIAELVKLQRGPADKGVRSAYAEVVDQLASRNSTLDQELLPKARADMKALRAAASAQQAQQAAPTPTAPAPAAPAAVRAEAESPVSASTSASMPVM